ncbi:MAG: DUF305 domain-containing protein [Actinomycetota bacterium]|nr:DUF305 domain-containing protein [Actinomycetota bacterium]
MSTTDPTAHAASPETDESAGREPGFWTRWFGPLTAWRVVALIIVFAFLGGTVGWVIRDRAVDPHPNAVDVGFARDMIVHHDQGVEMALSVLSDPTVPVGVRNDAQEIIIFQRNEIGLLNDSLARWGYATDGNGTSMAWMGMPVPTAFMPGLATDAEMARLAKAKGREAAALFLAMMSRHHLGGIEMARYAARHSSDRIMINLAGSMARNQSSEVTEYSQLRRRLHLPVPAGFSDPPTLPDSMDHGANGG